MRPKVGDFIRMLELSGDMVLLQTGELNVGRVIKIDTDPDSLYPYKVDFPISQDVPLSGDEIVEILDKEEFPEYYL